MKIDFPPHLCNRKCPSETKNGYKVSPQSYISIPPGTKIDIFVNCDPNDPESDVKPVTVITNNRNHIHAIMVDKMVVKNA